ncbi:baseplate tail-tube junction protein [uncultured Arcobacter sp.]|uniref:baseplate tail-tube junction protein n=1 Tax=uncultured Arcobacter sp. TaxID=165434 RepID=UPI0026125167|nr:baseplate tail-tube junction protein [uncultured Arcobacter sp.]
MLQFPLDVDKSNAPFIVFTPYAYNFDSVKTKAPVNRKEIKDDSVVLPLPNSGLTNNVNSNWNPEEGLLDLAGGGLAKAGQAVQQKTGSLSKYFTRGQFLNDYATLSYSGTDFRTFTFSWENMIPSQESESNILYEIFKHFERLSIPEYSNSATTPLLEYPSYWIISINLVNNAIQELFNIQQCVLSNITYDYEPNGRFLSFDSGHPVVASLRLTFTELKKRSRSDVI